MCEIASGFCTLHPIFCKLRILPTNLSVCCMFLGSMHYLQIVQMSVIVIHKSGKVLMHHHRVKITWVMLFNFTTGFELSRKLPTAIGRNEHW